jgi:hypothetical protein
MAGVLEREMRCGVGGMMTGVHRVAEVDNAGSEGRACTGHGFGEAFFTGLRGGIGDSGAEEADDGVEKDGQDGTEMAEGGEVDEEVLLQQELRSFRLNMELEIPGRYGGSRVEEDGHGDGEALAEGGDVEDEVV